MSLPRGEQALTGSDGAFALEVRRTEEKPARQECLVARDALGPLRLQAALADIRLRPARPKSWTPGSLVLARGHER
jgi:hypothetical protein